MGNCLKTQLKQGVNNDNLDILGYVTLDIKPNDSFSSGNNIIALDNGKTDPTTGMIMKTANSSVYYTGSNYVALQTDADMVKVLVPKYDTITLLNLYNLCSFKLSQVTKFMYLEELSIGGTALFNSSIEDLIGSSITKIWKEYTGMAGDIKTFATCPNLKEIHLSNCWDITGDLSSIKDMPNLEVVTIAGMPTITDVNNAADYMRNRGITVTIS